MTKEQKEKLLKLAKYTIASKLEVEETEIKETEFTDPIFQEKRGVFVTLHIQGQLRGCIGNIDPIYPLYEAVQRNAHEAAFGDPRFAPLTYDEYQNLDIEISVLTVPKKLEFSSADDLLIKLSPGKHGIVLECGMYKSTFLPQVWDDLPDKEQFLSHLCVKAGVEPNTWRKGECDVYTYEVEKF